MQLRRRQAGFTGDLLEELPLGEGLVVTDVIGLAYCLAVVEGEQQTLDDVTDVNERQSVVAGADDDPPAGAQAVGRPAKVELITRSEDGAGPDDHRWQVIFGDHPLHGHVPRRLGDRIRLLEWPQRMILADEPA